MLCYIVFDFLKIRFFIILRKTFLKDSVGGEKKSNLFLSRITLKEFCFNEMFFVFFKITNKVLFLTVMKQINK